MKRIRPLFCLATAALVVSPLAGAQGLDASLDCRADPQQFIAQLIDAKDIEAKPMKTSDRSVNAYGAHRDRHLTALGFPVKAVFGTPTDSGEDALAQPAGAQQVNVQQVSAQAPSARQAGEPSSSGAQDAQSMPAKYGVVVMAGSDQVSERLHQIGSPASVKEVMPLVMTAVICQK
ncbi:MAG TPA: hypothetical protein VL424_06785 [Pararobbsia sp.]|nr:hypothetical protein [Pararobbsia sp.]